MMNKTLATLALALTLASPLAAADLDPGRLETARRVSELAQGFGAHLRFTPEGLAATRGGSLPERLAPSLKMELETSSQAILSSLRPALQDAYAEAIGRRLTAGQLTAAETFLASPAGKAYVSAALSSQTEGDLSVARAFSADSSAMAEVAKAAAARGLKVPSTFSFPAVPPM